MSLLERVISPAGEVGRACEAVGGLWAPAHRADREAVAKEVSARGLRGLKVDGGEIGFLSRLPDLEFLVLASVNLSHLPPLPRLRYLQVTHWSGRLEIELPSVEWFFADEGPRGRSNVEAAYSAPRVRSLWLDGMYRDADLHPVTAPHLEALKLWVSNAVTSLDGIEQHAERLTHLDLFRLPKVASLAPLSRMTSLQTLHLAGMRQVTTLDEVAAIPGLRLLDLFDQKGIESLAPLAGHPTLEHISFGRTGDMDLSPLQEVPRLRQVHHGYKTSWKGTAGDVTQFMETDEDHPDRQAWRRLWWP